jgi:hypothetical protein
MKRVARFVPKKRDDLLPGMDAHIGKVFEFDQSFMRDDEDGAYAGQQTWVFARKHDKELGPDNAGRWVPDEDLEDLE